MIRRPRRDAPLQGRWVACDQCGISGPIVDGNSPLVARETAAAAGWARRDGQDVCPACQGGATADAGTGSGWYSTGPLATEPAPLDVDGILARVEAFALRALDVPPGSSEPTSVAFAAGAAYVAEDLLRLVSDLRAATMIEPGVLR